MRKTILLAALAATLASQAQIEVTTSMDREIVASGSSSSRIIREDRVWEYVYTSHKGDNHYRLFQVRFDGTEEHNGLIYHRLIHTGDIVQWLGVYDKEIDNIVFTGREVVPNDNSHAYLMREEDGRIYLLNKDMFNISWPLQTPAPDEFLVYDFNKIAGESYELLSGQWTWNEEPEEIYYMPCEIISTDTIEVEGVWVTVQNAHHVIQDFSIIEGIGFVKHGFLPLLYCDMRAHTYTLDCDLNRVYNADGEIIYRGLDIDPETVSVDAVAALPSPAIRYDGVTVTATGCDGKRISLTLLDVSGKVMSRAFGSGTLSSSTTGLSSGVYVAVAESDGMAVARRKFTVR